MISTSGQVIWHKAASRPHITYGSIAFASWRQCTSPSCRPRPTPQSASALYRCCPLLSRSENMDCQTSPGPILSSPQNGPFKCGNLDSIYGCFAHPSQRPERHHGRFRVFAGLRDVTVVAGSRPTDTPRERAITYSACSYRARQ